MRFDLVIQNGTVATASDVFEADIGIRDGVIVQIGRDLGEAADTIEPSTRPVLLTAGSARIGAG